MIETLCRSYTGSAPAGLFCSNQSQEGIPPFRSLNLTRTMPPKSRFLPMPRDDEVLDARNRAVEEWLRFAGSEEVHVKVQEFITSLRLKNERIRRMHPFIKGGYNLVYRLEYEDGRSVIMRVPIKDLVPFPDEKIIYEVSTMRYIATNTTIPVPHVYCHGSSIHNPTGLGPFIIMDYIDHYTNMSRELLDLSRPVESRPILDPGISEEKLTLLYGGMARILLQLHTLGPFSSIGSLVGTGVERRHHEFLPSRRAQPTTHNSKLRQSAESAGDSETQTKVASRPLTVNMIDLITDTGTPHDLLPAPSRTFNSTKEWYTALGAMHMAQLVFQHGDCVEDADDARDKYVARKLFEGLAASERLFGPWSDNNHTNSQTDTHQVLDSLPSTTPTSVTSAQGSRNRNFRLFSEDLRPANVLLDKDLEVVGVIDWEFVYSAPAEFSGDPPWWLLLSQPEDYPGGIFSWIREYDKRLGVFLRVLKSEEQRSERGRRHKDGTVPTKTRSRKRRKREKKDPETKVSPAVEPLLSQQMRDSWETGRWMVNYAARKSWMFDLVWWRFLDEAFFGLNEDQDYKARVGMLTSEDMDFMEEFVTRKTPQQAVSMGSFR